MIAGACGVAALSGTALSAARVLSNCRAYRVLLPSDPSGAEVRLDGALIWGAGLVFAVVITGIRAMFLRRA